MIDGANMGSVTSYPADYTAQGFDDQDYLVAKAQFARQ